MVGGQPFPPGGFGGGEQLAGLLGVLPWTRRNCAVAWKSGQVRQALGCGQSC